MSLNMVLLPAPFGPITLKIAPSSTSKLTWSTATRPPNRLVISRTSRSAMASSGRALGLACGVGRAREDAQPADQPGRRPKAQDAVRQPQHDRDHDERIGEL